MAKFISKIITFFISKNVLVSRNKIKWNLNLDEGIDLSVFLFGTSENKIMNINKLFPKKDTPLVIIDIGANIGSVSLLLAKNFKYSKVFAIEPTNYAFDKLIRNLKLNPNLSKKIFPYQIFLGSQGIKKPKSIYSSWNLNTILECDVQ